MEHSVCSTCGTQFDASAQPPAICPVCEDERQYVPRSGQRWTTLEALRREHRADLREEGGLQAIGTTPKFAIGQRALLVPAAGGNVLWDCVTVLDAAAVEAIEARGGLAAIAISHPHYYSTMVEWARHFDCPVVLHAADERWIMRRDPALELWEGEERELCGLRLLRLGGHFAGGTVAVWPEGADGAGALLAGDIVQVLPDPHHVGFMYSYPNYIPLPGATVTAMAARLADERFDAIYGAFWDGFIPRDGQAIVRRSAERYVRALEGELPG